MRSLSAPLASAPPRRGRGVRPCGARAHSGPPPTGEAPPDGAEKIALSAREFRRALGQSESYSRKHLRDEDAAAAMEAAGVGAVSTGGLVAAMKAAGNTHTRGDVTLRLAQSYGFCWGVERAVQMAYEARAQYPTQRMWITNEIIHNPSVNERLAEMGVQFITAGPSGKDFSGVASGDVVILPAFGASVHEMKLLAERDVKIVDTTCPWVSKVWNAVDAHARKVHTSIIHGKWAHEETVATASFATVYLIVKNLAEAAFVADYIVNGGKKEEFLARFDPQAMSAGFNPDVDLVRVGIANQTTMLKGETEQIGKLLQRAMMEKFGVSQLNSHFMLLDTICDATQERQDAMFALVDEKPDLVLVVGGFNSSNTQHLQEISEEAGVVSYWIDSAARIGPGNSIDHKTAHGELATTKGWLKPGKLTIGITSGASTPDKVVEDAIDAVFAIRAAEQAAVAR